MTLALTLQAPSSYEHFIVAAGATLCGVVVCVRAPRDDPGARRSWLLFGASFLTWAIGSVMVVGDEVFGRDAIGHGVANAPYLTTMALQLCALALHPSLSPRTVRLRVLANSLIIGASAVTVSWLVVGRRLYERTGDPIDTVATLAYSTIDVVLVALSFAVALRLGRKSVRRAPAQRRAALLLAGAFSLFLVGDLRQMAGRVSGVAEWLGMLTELAWLTGFAVVVRAVWVGRSRNAEPVRPERRRSIREQDRMLGAAFGLAPVLAAVFAGAVALTDFAVRQSMDPIGMLMLTTVVSMVLARQSLTLSDNQQLGRSLESMVADLQHQASHDGLTGLPNRSRLADRLRVTVDGQHDRPHRAALLFVDLDHLKPVNDSLGHAAGDELLRTTADRITRLAGPRVTRFGGDEFVVVLDDLPALDPTESAELIGRRIVEETAEPITIRGHVIRPSVSVGIAVAEPGVGPEELMRRADLALYQAKAKGRRCVWTYDPAGGGDARLRIDLESELRAAIRNDEFEVHYQPVVELATGRVEGVETLLRWRHPTRGLLLPHDFLDEAAAGGMLGAIGERTLMRVGADLSPIRHREDGPPLSVAVNLSTTELVDPRVVLRVRTMLKTFGMDPARLVIEITEDVVVDDTIRTTIDELRSLGAHLGIDDFGTGNSSLRQLGTYPADILKIDRSFIAHLEDDPHATTIVRAILGLARNLGLRTVAEGVETYEQARQLTRLGCDLAQGWLYAKAMPLDELEEFLAAAPPFHATVRPDVGTPGEPRRAVAVGAGQLPRRSSPSEASPMIRSSSSATDGRSAIAPTT